jgi:hypothetical protein
MNILKFKLSGPLKLDVAQGLRLEFTLTLQLISN